MRRDRPRAVRKLRVLQRRLGAWVDRRAPLLLLLVPSWGTSLFLHGLLLLVLALYLFVNTGGDQGATIEGRFATQLTEDLTSLLPGDRAGDPFTKDQTDEPPSLSIEPPRPEDTGISQPELPTLTKFAPDLASPELSRSAELTPAPANRANLPARRLARAAQVDSFTNLATGLHSESLVAPFSGRGAAERARLVRRQGGTVKSEQAVEDGLNWLVRHQRADGGWSLDYHQQCVGAGCPREQAMESDTAATGLALLPLLGAGHIHTEKSRYQGNVRQGLDWLVSRQQPDGDVYVGGAFNAHLYSHAIASMALCEAYGLSHDPKLRAPAQRAIDFIASAQNASDGGWRYRPGMPGDTSVFGWQLFAIRSARLAGLRIPRNVVAGCRTYLDQSAADAKKVTYSYQPGGPATAVMTAEALLTRQYLGWPRDFPALVKGASMVADHLDESADRNVYYWYYATQLLHNMQNKDWEKWNVRVRDGLVSMQVLGQGCDRGSWDANRPAPDRWGSTNGRAGAGRLFVTSLSVLTLEVYYRYLPLYQPTDGDKERLNEDPPAAAAVADPPAQ